MTEIPNAVEAMCKIKVIEICGIGKRRTTSWVKNVDNPLFTIDLSTGQHDGCVRSHNKQNEEQLPPH